MGFIKLYFRKDQGWASCETLKRHYKFKDVYERDDNGDFIFNLNKFFKFLVDDFAQMLASHKEDEKNFTKELKNMMINIIEAIMNVIVTLETIVSHTFQMKTY